MGHAQNKQKIAEITKPDHKLSKTFLFYQNIICFVMNHEFWLSYECFSILCYAFLLKSVISSHNSCGAKTGCQEENWTDSVHNHESNKHATAWVMSMHFVWG